MTVSSTLHVTANEFSAIYAEAGSYAGVARRLGVSENAVRTLRRRIGEPVPVQDLTAYRNGRQAHQDTHEQIAAVKPEAASPVPTPDFQAMASAFMQLMMSQMAGAMPTAAPANTPEPAVIAPVPEKRVFAQVKSAAATHSDEDYVGPLGDGRPYAGEIWGVTKKRKPLVLAAANSRPRTTLVIGDSHFHPGILPQTLRAMTLVGLHASEIMPEHIVHIGDGGDWASACQHVRNDTWKAKDKPSIRQDLDCFRENWNALNRPMNDGGVTQQRHYCYGNHDAWLVTLEDAHPEMRGLATGELQDILEGQGWTSSDYGEYAFIGGVGYVHVPLNMMGRPVGGQTGENTIANQSTRDTVFGHTHRHAVARRPKMDGVLTTVINCGSSMPAYYVGDYAQLTQGRALDYGVLEVTEFDGRIQSFRFVTMRELEHRYGKDADRRLR